MEICHTEHSHIIGKAGSNIKNVMTVTGCHIHFPDSNRSSATASDKSSQVYIVIYRSHLSFIFTVMLQFIFVHFVVFFMHLTFLYGSIVHRCNWMVVIELRRQHLSWCTGNMLRYFFHFYSAQKINTFSKPWLLLILALYKLFTRDVKTVVHQNR